MTSRLSFPNLTQFPGLPLPARTGYPAVLEQETHDLLVAQPFVRFSRLLRLTELAEANPGPLNWRAAENETRCEPCDPNVTTTRPTLVDYRPRGRYQPFELGEAMKKALKT